MMPTICLFAAVFGILILFTLPTIIYDWKKREEGRVRTLLRSEQLLISKERGLSGTVTEIHPGYYWVQKWVNGQVQMAWREDRN